MKLEDPFKVYTAASNLECHILVEMLTANGIPALAETDDSGVSLWGFGAITQFHQPNVWIESTFAEQARELIRQFEETKRQRDRPLKGQFTLEVQCEECGTISSFPPIQKGTTQNCPACGAYLDVGPVDWEEEDA
jgi:hypothetical protein